MVRSWWQRIFHKRTSPVRTRKRGSTRLMLLETLEDRFMPSSITVTGFADSVANNSHVTPSGSNFVSTDLRSAVSYANTHSNIDTIILLTTNSYKLTSADGGQLVLTQSQSLTIRSNSSILATIDAQHQSRLFDVESSGKTILDHLTLTNGTAPNSFDSDGGAIFNGSDLTLSNDLLNNNTTYGGTTGSHGAGGAVFTNGSKLTVTNTTFDHNTAQGGSDSNTNGGGAEGGAICAISGTVTITASTFSNNQAIGGNFTGEGSSSGGNAYGGAVEIRQESNIHLKIVNSTFAQNSAYGGHSTAGTSYGGVAYGGAIANGNISGSDNTVTLINDTIAFNHVFGGEGGGVANFGATSDFSSENTIIAKNTNVSGFSIVGPDVIGDFNSLGNNLIGNGADSFGFSALLHHDQVGTTAHPIDPKLGSLTFNGGPTKTLALLAGSPAIDKGNNNALIITGANDQRGAPFSRIVNGIIDIGAFEVQTSRGRLLVHH